MSKTVVLGCDKNNSNDKKFQDTVASTLKQAGFNVEKLAIAPGPFGNYSYTSKAKGKIGVYLMAGSLVSYLDGADSNFKYCYFGIRGDASRSFKTASDFKSKGVPKDHHGDCPASLCDKWAGKTYPQLNQAFRSKCCAVHGATPSELANNLLNAMGGGTGDASNSNKSSSSSSESESGDSGGTVKECIQKLLKHRDGDVECRIQGKNVYINKVRDPEKYYSCALTEGVNVYAGNTTVTDVNPDTPNHLIVSWKGGTFEFCDEKAIVRFGEKVKEIEAVKKVVTVVKEKSNNSSSDSSKGSDEETNDNNTDTTNTKNNASATS